MREVGKDGERVREGRRGEEEFEDEGMGMVGTEDLGVDLFEVGDRVGRRQGFKKGFGGWEGFEIQGRERNDGLENS